jgi:hypothetical protein
MFTDTVLTTLTTTPTACLTCPLYVAKHGGSLAPQAKIPVDSQNLSGRGVVDGIYR